MTLFVFVIAMTAGVAFFWQLVTNACTISTLLLKMLPKPDEVVTIFLLTVPPRHYLILWNLLRWISGSSSWNDRSSNVKNGNGVPKQP